MGLSFFNQRRAKEKEKQKLSASIDNAETLIDAKDDASLPHQEEEGLSLEPQPIEDIQITSEESQDSQDSQESETEEHHEESEVEETKEETKVEETEQAQTPKEKTNKVSDAQKIKNAKQKANKIK